MRTSRPHEFSITPSWVRHLRDYIAFEQILHGKRRVPCHERRNANAPPLSHACASTTASQSMPYMPLRKRLTAPGLPITSIRPWLKRWQRVHIKLSTGFVSARPKGSFSQQGAWPRQRAKQAQQYRSAVCLTTS